MSVIDRLDSKELWLSFMEERMAAGNMDKRRAEDLQAFIQDEGYLDVVGKIRRGENFQPPLKKSISKQNSQKKRVVYSFSRAENYVLKLLTYLLVRQYDHVFAPNLYSFRARQGVKRAIDYLRSDRHLSDRYVYKVDIHNYFNTVDVDILLGQLRQLMVDDGEAYAFIERLLSDSRAVLPDGATVCESKGIMAGVPISSFLANVYLSQMDWHFAERGNRYARYSDDIIVFARSSAERQEDMAYIRDCLTRMALTVNEDKEHTSEPHERWDFLGIGYQDGVFDVSPVSVAKLKKKMWRKSRALLRWKRRKEVDNIHAARAFVKSFNIKLYDNPKSSELTWSRWYFPIINTTRSLHMLDLYMQDCIRYIVTEQRTKGRFKFGYDMIKQLGYRSLVHEYYALKEQAESGEQSGEAANSAGRGQ